MSKLNLIPNEIKGYRIYPDQWNWTVVIVKVHGKDSKYAGQEYVTPMAYCKDLKSAVEYIMRTVAAIEGRKEQENTFDTKGIVADFDALQVGFKKASEHALNAVKELEIRLMEKGYDMSKASRLFSSKEESVSA